MMTTTEYASLPHSVMRDTSIDPSAKVVLMALIDRLGENDKCWPSEATIAADTGLCERTIRAQITELEALGYVTIERRPGYSSYYEIDVPPRQRLPETPAKVAACVKSSYGAEVAVVSGKGCHTPRQRLPETPAKVADEPLKGTTELNVLNLTTKLFSPESAEDRGVGENGVAGPGPLGPASTGEATAPVAVAVATTLELSSLESLQSHWRSRNYHFTETKAKEVFALLKMKGRVATALELLQPVTITTATGTKVIPYWRRIIDDSRGKSVAPLSPTITDAAKRLCDMWQDLGLGPCSADSASELAKATLRTDSDFVAKIPALYDAIKKATWLQQQPWFKIEWLVKENKQHKGLPNYEAIIAGQYTDREQFKKPRSGGSINNPPSIDTENFQWV